MIQQQIQSTYQSALTTSIPGGLYLGVAHVKPVNGVLPIYATYEVISAPQDSSYGNQRGDWRIQFNVWGDSAVAVQTAVNALASAYKGTVGDDYLQLTQPVVSNTGDIDEDNNDEFVARVEFRFSIWS